METINRNSVQREWHPDKIIQIGEGNFLRCFIGWPIDILNEKNGLDAGIAVVRPIHIDFPPSLNTQDGPCTTLLRGYDEQGDLRNEKRIISAVNKEVWTACWKKPPPTS
jgi:tagaturonate reductase